MMSNLQYSDLINYLSKDNIIGSGKEVKVYNYNDKVI